MSDLSGIDEPDLAQPICVLFVCTANICRSAYAEVVAKHLSAQLAGTESAGSAPVSFASAGTHGWDAHPLNPDIAEHLEPDLPHRDFASRRLTRAMVEEADLVLTAEASHRRFVLDEYPAAFRKVLTIGQFAEVAAGSDLRGWALVEEVARRQPPARQEHDVVDPYRRGWAANEAAARQIDGYLAIVVPALRDRP